MTNQCVCGHPESLHTNTGGCLKWHHGCQCHTYQTDEEVGA